MFSASRRIRNFEKRLRIERATSILVRVGKNFRSEIFLLVDFFWSNFQWKFFDFRTKKNDPKNFRSKKFQIGFFLPTRTKIDAARWILNRFKRSGSYEKLRTRIVHFRRETPLAARNCGGIVAYIFGIFYASGLQHYPDIRDEICGAGHVCRVEMGKLFQWVFAGLKPLELP